MELAQTCIKIQQINLFYRKLSYFLTITYNKHFQFSLKKTKKKNPSTHYFYSRSFTEIIEIEIIKLLT